MSVEIFNTTTNSIVDVPEEAVDAYLAQPAYRKVSKADRNRTAPVAAPDDPDTVTVSSTEYERRIQEAVSEALAGAEADHARALADAATKAEADKDAAVAEALAKAKLDVAQQPKEGEST